VRFLDPRLAPEVIAVKYRARDSCEVAGSNPVRGFRRFQMRPGKDRRKRIRPSRKPPAFNTCVDCGTQYRLVSGQSKRCPECRESIVPASVGIKFRRVKRYKCVCGNDVEIMPCVVCVALSAASNAKKFPDDNLKDS
jgi:hypothetical protein